MNRKLIIFLSILLFAALVLAGSLMKFSPVQKQISPTPTEPTPFLISTPIEFPTLNPKPSSPVPTLPPEPTEVIPPFTGELEVSINPTQGAIISQSFNLKALLPIDTTEFKLTYDYEIDKFIVIVIEPQKANLEKFQSWLKQNGYGGIPSESFVYK